MKKTYNSPKVLVVLVDTQDMICDSLPKSQTTINDNNAVLGRRDNRGSFWEDEEE